MKHQFALYVPRLGLKNFMSTDLEFIHRLVHVLRATIGEQFILFDKERYGQATLTELSKRAAVFAVSDVVQNRVLEPIITLYVPLLKRESLEDAVYVATELGVNRIQLVISQKSQQKISDSQFVRLEKIIIAAGEQAKQFVLPELHKPVALEALKFTQPFVWLDSDGRQMFEALETISPVNIGLIVGPEGDFTESEKRVLAERGGMRCKLTPTILRSRTAVAVGMGMVRSWFTG